MPRVFVELPLFAGQEQMLPEPADLLKHQGFRCCLKSSDSATNSFTARHDAH